MHSPYIGERSTYLGPEDLHESKFNSMKLSALMTDFDKNDFGTTYNGPSVNKYWCPWKIELYATKDLENEFLTDNPIYYMLVVLAVFVFVSVVFVIYDILVEMQQKKLLTGAVKSDRIVASFFPKEFRDRLYEENKEKAKSKAKKKTRSRIALFNRELCISDGKCTQLFDGRHQCNANSEFTTHSRTLPGLYR